MEVVKEADLFTGRLGFHSHVNSDEDAFAYLEMHGKRDNLGLYFGNKILFIEENYRRFIPVNKYQENIALIRNSGKTIHLANVCCQMKGKSANDIKAFASIPGCDVEHLECNSVTPIAFENISDQLFLMAATFRAGGGNYLDTSIVDISEEPPKKKQRRYDSGGCGFLSSMINTKFARTIPHSDIERYTYSECNYTHRVTDEFVHSGDMISKDSVYLVHTFETSKQRVSQMKENRIYAIVISSYQHTKSLAELCKEAPQFILYNQELLMIQKIPFPQHQIIQNSRDSNCFCIGGLVMREGKLYFISPATFPAIGNLWIPLNSIQHTSTAVQIACAKIKKFNDQLLTMFTEYMDRHPEEEGRPPPTTTTITTNTATTTTFTETPVFKRMVIIHNSTTTIKRLSKYAKNIEEEEENGAWCLYVLVDNHSVRYFKSMESLLEYARLNPCVDSSSSPCLSIPLGLCLNNPNVIGMNVVNNPYENWAIADEQIKEMDSIKIYVDGDTVTDDKHIQSAAFLVSGEMILVCKKTKPSSLVPINLLGPVSSISYWPQASDAPQYSAGFKNIPTDQKRITVKRNTNTYEVLIEDTFISLQDVLKMIKERVLDVFMVEDYAEQYALVVYQISMLCSEGQLREILKNLRQEICAILETCKNEMMDKTMTEDDYGKIRCKLNSFLQNLSTNGLSKVGSDGDHNNAERLLQRNKVASNVAEVKQHGFNPMEIPGENIIFQLPGGVMGKIPMSLGDGVCLGTPNAGLLMDTEVFSAQMKDTFICQNLPPGHEQVFLLPICNDSTSKINKVTAVDWSELAVQKGLPTNLVRIHMREIMSRELNVESQSDAVTQQLLKLLLSASNIILQQNDSECLSRICRGMFITLYMLMISGNRFTFDLPYIFTTKNTDKSSSSFLKKRENIDTVLCLRQLLERSNFEDKDSASENLSQLIYNHIKVHYTKTVPDVDVKRDNDMAAGKLLDKLEPLIVGKFFEFEDSSNNNSDQILEQYGKWMLQTLQEYSLTDCQVLSRDRGNAYTLNYLGGIVDDYMNGAKKFGLAKGRLKSHCIGRLAYRLYCYISRPEVCDPDIYLYHVKKIVAEAVIRNPDDWRYDTDMRAKIEKYMADKMPCLKKIDHHFQHLNAMKKINHRFQELNSMYDLLLKDILKGGYKVDSCGYFIRDSVGAWASIIKSWQNSWISEHQSNQICGLVNLLMNKTKKRELKPEFLRHCWMSHHSLVALLVYMGAAIEIYEKGEPRKTIEIEINPNHTPQERATAAEAAASALAATIVTKSMNNIRMVSLLLEKKYPNNAAVQLAQNETFQYCGHPGLEDINEYLADVVHSKVIADWTTELTRQKYKNSLSQEILAYKKSRAGCTDVVNTTIYVADIPDCFKKMIGLSPRLSALLHAE